MAASERGVQARLAGPAQERGRRRAQPGCGVPVLTANLLRALLFGGGLLAAVSVSAADVYQAPEAFVAEAFSGTPPAPRLLWLTGTRADAVREILGHAPPSLRVRFWTTGARSVWVLEEIGKHHPITAGFVVEEGRIASARVLVYRESRGWEVRRPAFLAQLEGRTLTVARELDGPVDGISGATLSVAAMQRMTRLALYLAGQASAEPSPDAKDRTRG